MGASASKRLLRNLCVRCVVDDVNVGTWELIFYQPPLVFSLSVEDGFDWVDVASCVGSAVVGVSVCICDKSEAFVLTYL